MEALTIAILSILTTAVITMNFRIGYLEAEIKVMKEMLEKIFNGEGRNDDERAS
ncbi:MAG: hypothetical protein QXY94_02550 [Archaeoglobaceae archaeon]